MLSESKEVFKKDKGLLRKHRILKNFLMEKLEKNFEQQNK